METYDDDDAILSQLLDALENENPSVLSPVIEEKCSHETRFKKMDEKDLLELASESIPTNTKRKAMWAFRLYESWQNWRKSNFADEQDEKSKDL
ncbi:hypothetical protein AC249_AIPGENE7886 [Exaiptasia diaphana]|nr:hypothetical protein AC249_AIPGENE7886 [Exaiptasia diaphana]